MSVLDKNRVFFGLIHYILSEQKNVDWIIKSSLIDFTGISSLLEEKPYKTDDILDEIIDYVKSIKPYHVQFSKYYEKYETASEHVNIPRDDYLNTTILQRFDRIKPTSDIVLDFYECVNSYTDLSDIEYNTSGLLVYSLNDNNFFERTRVYDEVSKKYHWEWIEVENRPSEGLYYETKTNSYYKYEQEFYDNELDSFVNKFSKLSVEECRDVINYHYGNRLYNLGLHDNDEIRKELNANFKGLDISGGVFDIGRFGYDVFNYDTNDYDIPTIIYDYCIIDKSESFESINMNDKIKHYDKEFVTPGEHQFRLLNTEEINLAERGDNEELSLWIKDKAGSVEYVSEYSIQGDYIDIFKPIGLNKTLYIVKTSKIKNLTTLNDEYVSVCQVIASYPFIESDSDVIKRKYVIREDLVEKYSDSGRMYGGLEIPNSLDSSKMVVQLKSSIDGSRKNINSNYYTIKDNKLFIINPNTLSNFDHIIITSFDYKYLYDKIYLWEDKYGRSNNIINLDGNNFLRGLYEDGRPSELSVSHPLNDMFLYKRYNNNSMLIFRNDYKNDMFSNRVNLSLCSKINNIEYEDENELVIKSISLTKTNNLPDAPGKVLINSEIIEYNEINRINNTISKLRRGADGSMIYMHSLNNHIPYSTTHKIGDLVIAYTDIPSTTRTNKYISYNINDNTQEKFVCPSGVKNNSRIYVSKLPKINLLEDITLSTTTIKVDSPNVINNTNDLLKLLGDSSNIRITGDFVLKINDDAIPFKTIYKIDGQTFAIEDFTLPLIYSQTLNTDDVIYNSKTAFVSSSIPLEMKNINDKTTLDNILYINDTFYVDYEQGSLLLTVEQQPQSKEISEQEFLVKIDENNHMYKIVGSIVNGIINGVIYNVDSSIFGSVSDNMVIQKDGTIYAKIENNQFYTINHVVKLMNPELFKRECIKINVVDEEFTYTEEEIIEDTGSVTLTFITDPLDATLEIDGGEFIDVDGVITVPTGTIIKYKATCKGYYDLEGEIVADVSKEVILTLTKEIIIENADYIVLKYIWTDGQDLDTETAIVNATNISSINNQYIGWKSSTNQGFGPSVPRRVDENNCVLYWAGDNMGSASESSPKEENILINVKNLLSETYYDNLPLDIIAKLSATFYTQISSKPVKLELVGYKGGTMKYSDYKFFNEGGEHIKIRDNMGVEHDSISLFVSNISQTLQEYRDIASITINKENKQFKLSSI